jgi:hypothetical protein
MWDDARLSAFQGFAPPRGWGGLGSSSVAGAALPVAVAVQVGGVPRVTAPERGLARSAHGVAAEQPPHQHLCRAAAP